MISPMELQIKPSFFLRRGLKDLHSFFFFQFAFSFCLKKVLFTFYTRKLDFTIGLSCHYLALDEIYNPKQNVEI